MKTTFTLSRLKKSLVLIGALMMPLPISFLGVGVVSDAYSATATATLTVTASILNNCAFTSGSSITLAFGTYDPIDANASADKDASTTFNFQCTVLGTAAIAMDNGANFDTTRRMNDGSTNYLGYALYQDAGRTTAWGTGANDYDYSQGLSLVPSTITIYGRIPAGQNSAPGSYTDTVTVTATF